MPTTAGGINYPSSSDTIDIPGDLQLLAEDVEDYITANAVTPTGVYTLTNKTLTSPIVDGSGVIFEGATADGFETTLTVTDPTADRTITLPNSTGTVALTTDITVTESSSNTLTNKTLTSPVINYGILKSPEERCTISATAASSTVNFDALTQGVLYYTSDATGNWTLNVRGDGSTTLNSMLTAGDSITIVFLVTQGATAYYSNAFTIDGTSVTPKYITGTAFSSGNASSIDSYVYTIFKTGNAAFTVLASQTKFA